MVRSLDDLNVDDDALIVECTECDTGWVFEPHSETAYDFEPTEHGHADHETEWPVPAERYLRGHEWVVDHKDSVEREIFHCRADAEASVARSNGLLGRLFGDRVKEPWMREVETGLPVIRGYSIDTDELDSEESARFTGRVVRAFTDASQRTVTTIDLMGMPSSMRDHDPGAFEQLIVETGIDLDDDWLNVTVPVTERVLDSVTRLFVDGLIEVVFYDSEGRKTFTRYDTDLMTAFLEATSTDEFFESLSSADRERISRGGWE